MTTVVPSLDLYDVAFLAGGPDRVVDTAVVALVQAGRVRIHSPGQLATVELSRRHPVETAVLDALGPSGHRSVDTIRGRVTDDDRLLDVGRRLRGSGLAVRYALPLLSRRGPATRAGRRLLREFSELTVAGDPEAVRVALRGREAMSDTGLCEAIFERPVPTPGVRGARRSRHDIDHGDPQRAAVRARAAGAAGAAIGLEGFDGGGF